MVLSGTPIALVFMGLQGTSVARSHGEVGACPMNVFRGAFVDPSMPFSRNFYEST